MRAPAALAALALCASAFAAEPVPEPAGDDLSAPAAERCPSLGREHLRLNALSAPAFAAEIAALGQPQTPCAALRLGLLLSHPRSPQQHDATALEWLSQALLALGEDPAQAPLRQLIDHVQERQLLRNQLGRQGREIAALRAARRRDSAARALLVDKIERLTSLDARLEDKARSGEEITIGDDIGDSARPPGPPAVGAAGTADEEPAGADPAATTQPPPAAAPEEKP